MCFQSLKHVKNFLTILPVIYAFQVANAQTTNLMSTNKIDSAYLGGGCFWCMEAVFDRLPGVVKVTSGYAGGHTDNPTYEDVCSETTGQAEVTRIDFDATKVSYDKILATFWQAHDPTTLNRQGADEGTSYRSIILYTDANQKTLAEKSKAAAQGNFHDPIVTEIVPLKQFYPAEGYHQGYFDAHTSQGYCQVVIAPKLYKLEKNKVIESTPQTK